MKLQLSIAMDSNPRTRPILDGRVEAEGIEFRTSEIFPSELFWRQLRFGDFDVSEMSFSSLMMIAAQGDDRWMGLPIFTTRHFFQTWALARSDRVKSPADLKGKRVGVPEYQQTAALWTRGILQHEWGVAPKDMEFWMERTPDHSHAGATGFKPPLGVTIRQIPHEKNIGSMLVSGELDATLLYITSHNLVDRSRIDFTDHPVVKPLFSDPIAEGTRFFDKTGIYPINHAFMIKRAVLDKNPWAALNIFKAFERANEIADRERLEHIEYHLRSGLIPPQSQAALRRTLAPHGIKANRKTLETAAQYSVEQGLTPRLMKLDELFAPSTIDQ
jgi:4,5-dihydroxyphthalate decarboxylase